MHRWILFFILGLYLPAFAQEMRYDTLRLFYPIDKTELEAVHKTRLDSLSVLLNRSKKVKISITGYADYLGTNPHNVDLSVSRALKVKDYLASKGFDTNRISHCDGKGALSPDAVKNKREKGIPLHRRVDVVVGWLVGKKPPPKSKKEEVQGKPLPRKLSQLDLANMKTGDNIVVDNLNFIGGRHVLMTQSYPTLKKLATLLNDKPLLKIEIQGHICCDSFAIDGYDSDTRTNTLSVNRAKYVYDQLINTGIDSTRLTYRGFGGKFRLIKDERTGDDQAANRRVEIKIMSTGNEETDGNAKSLTPKTK